MTEPKKSPFRLLVIVTACLLAVVAILLVRHRGDKRNEPPTKEDTSQTKPSGKGRQRGGAAPAASSSDAVDALVRDDSLPDLDRIAGLRHIVEDPGHKMEERKEALEHVLNLIPADKPDLLREMATRKVIPDEIRMRLAADALNRPHHLQGEILVALLADAAGDSREELLKSLTFLCGGEDLGDDLAAWRKAVDNLPPDP